MLNPTVVGVPLGRYPVGPSSIVAQLVTAPIVLVEWGVGDDVVDFDVLVGVVEEEHRVPFDLCAVDASDGRFILHKRQVVWLLSCP